MEEQAGSDGEASKSELVATATLTPQQRGALITNSGNSPLAKYDKKQLAKELITRYVDGEDMASLATELGVTRKRLYQVLVEQDEEGWKSAQVSSAIDRLEKAKEALDTATNALDLARARESAKVAQWELERTCRRIYGTDTPNHLGSGTVQINISMHRQQYSNDHAQVIDIKPDKQAE